MNSAVTIEKTVDYPLLAQVLGNPPVQHPSFLHLLAKDGDEILALFIGVASSAVCLEIHIYILPGARGARGRRPAGRRSIGFGATPAR